jgi:CRP/FNR family cyclic AMP-dependent transcriptional regulator
MTFHSGAGAAVCNVLREDSDLAEAVPSPRREEVAEACTVGELLIPPGSWSGEGERFDGLGMLVLQGLLIRRVGVEGRYGAELLSRGDVLRPWQEDERITLPLSSSWVVHEPARLAVLDDHFLRLISRYPKIASRLVSRALRRSRYLAVNMAIVHQARVDTRLHMLMWHLAGRFGRVRSDGVIVPLRLTHAMLAELVAARRPTVTTALSTLAKEGRVRLVENAWLLSGDPPGELSPITMA